MRRFFRVIVSHQSQSELNAEYFALGYTKIHFIDYSQLDFIIYHDPYTSGTSVSSGVVYQDDGETTAYLEGDISEVFISATSKNPAYDKNIHIQAYHKGSYGVGKMQGYSIVIPNVSPSFQIHTDDMPPYTHSYNSYGLTLV